MLLEGLHTLTDLLDSLWGTGSVPSHCSSVSDPHCTCRDLRRKRTGADFKHPQLYNLGEKDEQCKEDILCCMRELYSLMNKRTFLTFDLTSMTSRLSICPRAPGIEIGLSFIPANKRLQSVFQLTANWLRRLIIHQRLPSVGEFSVHVPINFCLSGLLGNAVSQLPKQTVQNRLQAYYPSIA